MNTRTSYISDNTYEICETDLQIDKASKLGSGACGSVYMGRIKGVDQTFAIKLVELKDTKRKHSCEQEKNIMKVLTLSNAPYSVLLRGYCVMSNTYAICMDLADKDSLDAHLNDLDEERQIRIMLNLSMALDHLHQYKIVHCDIKPANVLLTNDWSPKLCDYGLSYMIDVHAPRYESGSLRFKAPEVLLNTFLSRQGKLDSRKPISTKSDIYSLGITFWCIVAKSSKPFPDVAGIKNIADTIMSKREKNPIPSSCPEKIKNAIEQASALEPVDRPKARHLIKMLQ